jgi:type IV pilus assembly protein PilV
MLIDKRRGVVRLNNRRKGTGVSLLEVLISILLAALGLLALAGANVSAIRYSKMSQYRGTATLLAQDIAERMRANKLGLGSYSYTTDWSGQASAVATDTSCEGAVVCTASLLAAYDLATWRKVVRDQLPRGSVVVSIQGTVGADVWIAWQDPAVANTAENSTDSRNTAADTAKECPPAGLGFTPADTSVRCSFFRINL